jgi:hypothetical protein
MGDTYDTVGSTLGAVWGPFGHLSDNKIITTCPPAIVPAAARRPTRAGL